MKFRVLIKSTRIKWQVKLKLRQDKVRSKVDSRVL